MKRLSLLLMLLAAVLAAVIALSTGGTTNAQEDDVMAAFDNMVAAFNEGIPNGDGALIAAAFTENGVFTNRDDAFMVVGRPALEASFTFDDSDATFQATITEAEVDGDTVTGSADVVDQDTIDAGVASHVELFTATVEDGLVASFVLTYGDDPDTQTYLAYLEGLDDGGGDEPFPGAVEIALAGEQPGAAFIAEDPAVAGVAFVVIEIEPGEGDLQPAHVHTGTCEEPGGIVYPLAYLLDGGSFTILSTTQADLLGNDYILNVHLSEAEMTTYPACGVLTAADDGGDGGVGLPSTGTGGATDSNGMAWLIAGLAVVGVGGVVGAGTLAARRR